MAWGHYFFHGCAITYQNQLGVTLMFDETTTEQNKKQMDLLIRNFDETEEKVVTKFLGCVMFCRATADDICDLFIKLHDDKVYDLPWGRLF